MSRRVLTAFGAVLWIGVAGAAEGASIVEKITGTTAHVWPNERNFNPNQPSKAVDGNTGTFTWSTAPYNGGSAYLAVDLHGSYDVGRIRLHQTRDDYGGWMLNIYTSSDPDSIAPANRSYTPVTGLTNGYNGTELANAWGVRNASVAGINHTTGWWSMTFDVVEDATTVAVWFNNVCCHSFNHFPVNEFEVYSFSEPFLKVGVDEGSVEARDLSGPGDSKTLSGLGPHATDASIQNGAVVAVGDRGVGTLNVDDGAMLTVEPGATTGAGLRGGMRIGESADTPGTANGIGQVNVSGAGTTITFSEGDGDAGTTVVGGDGTGILSIADGAVVDGAAQKESFVGKSDGGVGFVNVLGPGSTWKAGDDLFVGGDGTGIVTVGAGGEIVAGNLHFLDGGVLTGGGGKITGTTKVNGGLVAVGTSPGSMTFDGDVEFEFGTLELEIQGNEFDQLDVAGTVSIGKDAFIHLVLDIVPAAIDIDDFFVSSLPVFDPLFSGDNIRVFTNVVDEVGSSVDVHFGGSFVTAVAAFGTGFSVPEPTSLGLLVVGLAGLGWMRRRQDV